MYDMQYAGLGFNILVPRHDESRLVNKKNVIDEFSAMYKVDMSKLTYKQIPFMLCIMGNIDRNIYGIKGTGKSRAASTIRTAVECGGITPDTDNIDLLLKVVKTEFVSQIKTNYNCIDIITQYDNCTAKDIYNITSQMVNKFDNVALKELNDKYFEEYPLMLGEITSKPKETRQVIF